MSDAVRRAARLVRYAVLMEIAIWRCLARWVVRRPDVPAGSIPIGYARLVTPVLSLWIFACAVEVPLVHVLLPWDALRLPLLALGVWGLLWMVGLLAGYRVRPHLLGGETLRIRSGPRTEVVVPLAALDAVRAHEHEVSGSLRSVSVEDDTVCVNVSGRTNLLLTLGEPTPVATRLGEVSARHVRLWVDEPREVAAMLRAHARR